MLPVEEVLRIERESEDRRKRASIARKKRATRLKLAFFGSVAFFVFLISPIGLQVFMDFSKSRSESTFFRVLLQKSADLIWVYGYYQESYESYKHLYDQYNTLSSNEDVTSINLYNMALTQYMMKEYRTALIFYQVYKKRWPKNEDIIAQVDRRINIIAIMSPNSLGLQPAEWILDLADKYEIRY